jgi:hypothetical protein
MSSSSKRLVWASGRLMSVVFGFRFFDVALVAHLLEWLSRRKNAGFWQG